MVGPRTDTSLYDRRDECDALDRLVANAHDGLSGTLVIRGQPGAGKTALLDYVLVHTAGSRIARASGVESEMELPFAGLHQLCASFLDRLERLPGPQRDALGIAFGLHAGDPPDRFLVGLAVLSLLADVADDQPVVCLVDDVQWLDRASLQVLGFVARRLAAEAVVMVFGIRQSVDAGELAGLTEMTVGPLTDGGARALLASAMPGRLDASVRDRIITEAGGNPLALLELPRAWTPAAFAGGFGLPDSVSVSERIEESFRRRLTPLPEPTKRLLLVAAAEPIGDPALIWTAARRLGIDDSAAGPAAVAGLLEAEGMLRFRHPLVRSVVYRDASSDDRRLVHAELARATDPILDPDRRAWHRAQAADGPDEAVAAELEQSAGRAQARGGVAAAAAFLERSVALTVDPARRTERALYAAESGIQAGTFDAVSAMLATAESGELNQLQRARIHLLRGRVATSSSFGTAVAELLRAADEIAPLDVRLSRETYLDAWGAALAAGDLGGASPLRDVSRAARSARRRADEQRPSDHLLDGLTHLVTDGLGAATPALREAVREFRHDEQVLRFGAVAATAAAALWDMDGFATIMARQLELARGAGALALLATALQGAGIVVTSSGDFGRAAALVAEADEVTIATGVRIAPYGGMLLAAYMGREPDASALIATTIEGATAGGEGLGVQYARWVTAVLANGLGHYDAALVAARLASDETPELFVSDWALAELVEAATRAGEPAIAETAAERLVRSTRGIESDWAQGFAARALALVGRGAQAEEAYRNAIERLSRTPLRPELGRAHLVYGEWLRREGRRVDAREHLRLAYDGFVGIGMDGYGERARRELSATGETVRKRSVDTQDQLTPQEQQIAHLVAAGHTNPEIGSLLFLSPRTVEWHLRKVFDKLEIHSRRDMPASFGPAIRNERPEGVRARSST